MRSGVKTFYMLARLVSIVEKKERKMVMYFALEQYFKMKAKQVKTI